MPTIQEQMLELVRQQTALSQRPNPALNTGLLSGNQQGLGDVATNPDQAQINALLGIGAGFLNPSGGQPGLTAATNALQAFGGQRQAEFKSALKARELEGESLRDRLSGLKDLSSVQTSQGQLQVSQDKETRLGIRDAEDVRQFGVTETRLSEGQRFQQILDNLKLEADVLKAGDIVDEQIGVDEFGNPINQKVRVNQITGDRVPLTGGRSLTTPANRAMVKELKGKSSKALREGNDIFFDDNLDTIFGSLDFRAEIGSLTEGRIAGESVNLRNKYNRFVTERVLDVARILAPVTEVDVDLLMKQLAPSTTFGNAAEARKWYTGTFMPKVLSEMRFNGSPLMALDMASQIVHPKMNYSELGSVIGSLPAFDEIQGIQGSKKQRIWVGEEGTVAQGKALTLPVLKVLAQKDGITVSELINKASLREVGIGQEGEQ